MTFYRQIGNRFRSRLAAARDHSMFLFIFPGMTAGTNFSIYSAGIVALITYVVRVSKAFFDFIFETIGFLIGAVFYGLPQYIRIGITLALAGVITYLIIGKSWIFIAGFLILLAVDALLLGTGRWSKESRLLAAPAKAFIVIEFTLSAAHSGWVWAVVAFLLTRRASSSFLEGLVITEAALDQKVRDQRLTALFATLRKGGGAIDSIGKPIFLYLRPFAITGRQKLVSDGEFQDSVERIGRQDVYDQKSGEWMRTELPIFNLHVGVRERGSILEENSETEAALERALETGGHFVALGNPGEALGAARLASTEQDWREAFKLIINAATLCIVIPSSHEGTLEELNFICNNGFLQKCCMFMPPASKTFSYEKEWAAAAEKLMPLVELPSYKREGMIFRYSSSGAIVTPPPLQTIPRSLSELFYLSIRALFPELPHWQYAG